MQRNFSEENKGCKYGVSSGITWFFEHEEQGIILEDDCIPQPDFFSFCEKMLTLYANNDKVMHINGTTFIQDTTGRSHYFSQVPHVWGWATWRWAWQKVDLEMKERTHVARQKSFLKLFKNKIDAWYWMDLFRYVNQKNVDTWDVSWVYSVMSQGGVCVACPTNMVENIGFDEEATHTKKVNLATLPAQQRDSLGQIEPTAVKVDKEMDHMIMKKVFHGGWVSRITRIIKMVFFRYHG